MLIGRSNDHCNLAQVYPPHKEFWAKGVVVDLEALFNYKNAGFVRCEPHPIAVGASSRSFQFISKFK